MEKIRFGKYSGKPLNEIPADYLLSLYKNVARLDADVYIYVSDHYDELQKQASEDNK